MGGRPLSSGTAPGETQAPIRGDLPSYGLPGGDVDLGGTDARPDLMMEAGLWKGADAVLARTGQGGWGLGRRLDCFSRLRVDWQKETAVAVLGRDCLGRHGRVRVAAVAYETQGDESGSDWLGDRRTFTSWVHRG